MTLLELLASFNRKERFYLVGWALGNPGFALDDSFRQELGELVETAIPANPFVAMDYDLDWIYASLFLASQQDRQRYFENTGHIHATQEDADLLVAFDEPGITRLVLLEAKGATGWGNRQLAHKADRLRAIFGEDGRAWAGVAPHFVIASPTRPSRLSVCEWPTWMVAENGQPAWLPMSMPADLQRITRCDETGRPFVGGQYWTVLPSSRPRPRPGGDS